MERSIVAADFMSEGHFGETTIAGTLPRSVAITWEACPEVSLVEGCPASTAEGATAEGATVEGDTEEVTDDFV
jgi:hypothetical protein